MADCTLGSSTPLPNPIRINGTHLLTPEPIPCLNIEIFANDSTVHLEYLDACFSTLSIRCSDQSRCNLACDVHHNISLTVTVYSERLSVTTITASCIEQRFFNSLDENDESVLSLSCPDTYDLWSGSYNNGEWKLSLADNYNDITVKRSNGDSFSGRVQPYKGWDGWVEFETTVVFFYLLRSCC